MSFLRLKNPTDNTLNGHVTLKKIDDNQASSFQDYDEVLYTEII